VLSYLDGEIGEEQAKQDTISATRRFARRQDSWFRKDPRIGWVGWDDPDRVERGLEMVRAGAAGT
jgi:tRNA dimethylallyltransferase